MSNASLTTSFKVGSTILGGTADTGLYIDNSGKLASNAAFGYSASAVQIYLTNAWSTFDGIPVSAGFATLNTSPGSVDNLTRELDFNYGNEIGAVVNYGYIYSGSPGITNGAENGLLGVRLVKSGTITDAFTINASTGLISLGTGYSLEGLLNIIYNSSNGDGFAIYDTDLADYVFIIDSAHILYTFGQMGLNVRTPTAEFDIATNGALRIGHIIKGYAAQSANLSEWRNSSDEVLAYVTADGNIKAPNLSSREIMLFIDGLGEPIVTGEKAWVRIPFNGVITGWEIVADQTGSIVIDVWKSTYATFPPTVANTITGSEKPTLTAQAKNTDTSLSTWTTSIEAGSYIKFNVDSTSGVVTKIILTLMVTS